MTSKKITWDAEADRKLFLGILKTQNVTIDYKAMAKYMSTDDQVCTVSALQNRMFKLKAMAKSGEAGEGGNTPKKEKTPARKRGAAASPEGETPTKKGKTTKGKHAKAIAAEEDDDEETEVDVKRECGSEDEPA